MLFADPRTNAKGTTMALDPNISLGVRPLQLPDPLAQMAQMSQIQASQRQGEVSRMQLEDLKNDRIEMLEMQRKMQENGGSANLDELAKTMLKTPKFFAQGVELTRKLKEQADFEDYGRRLHPELFGPTARTPSAVSPSAAPAAQNASGTGMEPVNALASNATPAPAPVNALAAPANEPYPGYNEAIGMTPSAAPARAQQLSPSGKTRQQLQGEIFLAQRNPLFKGLAETAKLELAEMMKAPVYHNVPGVGLVNPITKDVVMAAAPAPTTLARLQAELALLPKGDPRIPAYEAMIKKETTHTPGVSVSVSTEKKYGEAFGGKLADRDDAKLGAAEKAPQLAESANRIINLVSQGNVFTGPVADIKLNIARALNVAGTNNEQKIANTEQLIQGTGQSTLDAIKSAGLGTGQGFTDKDLKFLQGIAGGTIKLTAQTLTELAALQHRAATRSVQAWNTRFKDIPKSSIEGMGLRAAPDVPPLTAGKAAGPATGTIQDGYRFKGGSPADPKNWEKM